MTALGISESTFINVAIIGMALKSFAQCSSKKTHDGQLQPLISINTFSYLEWYKSKRRQLCIEVKADAATSMQESALKAFEGSYESLCDFHGHCGNRQTEAMVRQGIYTANGSEYGQH